MAPMVYTKAQSSSSVPPQDFTDGAASASDAARNPNTGQLDSGNMSDSDSAAGEAWTDMNPFKRDWDALGLDDEA